jgi:hypothetical protein
MRPTEIAIVAQQSGPLELFGILNSHRRADSGSPGVAASSMSEVRFRVGLIDNTSVSFIYREPLHCA